MYLKSDPKVVVIAGASAGLGRATAEAFSADGAHVILLARGKERLTNAVDNIGGRVHGIATDVGDPASVRAAFEEIAARHDYIDVLINNAGIGRVTLIEHASDDDIAAVVSTNFLGPIYTTRAGIPMMRAAGGGHIINVSSEVTLDDLPYMTLYSSTKRALNGFTQTMSKELRDEGIRVTLLVLGSVGGTSFADGWTPDQIEAAAPAWEADGYRHRVSRNYRPMNAATAAPEFLHIVTRPPEMMLDVLHVRAAGSPIGSD